MARLEQLKQFVDDDPSDPFNLYALALEYLKTDTQEAFLLFERLLNEHEQYLPTYYQAANLFVSLGKRKQAITVLEKGMTLSRVQQESKTLRELQAVYNELVDDDQ